MSEPAHIMSTEIIMEMRRPRRSAIRPNSQPPTGRIKKPTANTPAVLNNWEVASPLGKNAEGYLRLLNGQYPGGEPVVGQTLKIVE